MAFCTLGTSKTQTPGNWKKLPQLKSLIFLHVFTHNHFSKCFVDPTTVDIRLLFEDSSILGSSCNSSLSGFDKSSKSGTWRSDTVASARTRLCATGRFSVSLGFRFFHWSFPGFQSLRGFPWGFSGVAKGKNSDLLIEVDWGFELEG